MTDTFLCGVAHGAMLGGGMPTTGRKQSMNVCQSGLCGECRGWRGVSTEHGKFPKGADKSARGRGESVGVNGWENTDTTDAENFRIAYSYDGLHWSALNNNEAIVKPTKTVNDQGTPMRIASSAGSGRGKKGAPVSGSEARHDRHQVAKAGGRIVQQELDSDRLVTGPATGGQASSGGHSSG